MVHISDPEHGLQLPLCRGSVRRFEHCVSTGKQLQDHLPGAGAEAKVGKTTAQVTPMPCLRNASRGQRQPPAYWTGRATRRAELTKSISLFGELHGFFRLMLKAVMQTISRVPTCSKTRGDQTKRHPLHGAPWLPTRHVVSSAYHGGIPESFLVVLCRRIMASIWRGG